MADEQHSDQAVEAQAEQGAADAGETAVDQVETDAAELMSMLEDARNKADENWNRCLRLQADVENLRKRNQRDLESAHKYALEKFAMELLPVRDGLEMGIDAANAGDSVDPAKLLEGTEMTLNMFSAAMEKFGLVQVNPEGEAFNPEFHQAMSMQERDDVAPNTVVTVVQKGYVLNERLLRPAMVIVSKAPA